LKEDFTMNANQDLVGKTITGVIASAQQRGGVREIWMLQFSDGSHVEFVSPKARSGLKRTSRAQQRRSKPVSVDRLQLALNVA
jgi:hypothetical protein